MLLCDQLIHYRFVAVTMYVIGIGLTCETAINIYLDISKVQREYNRAAPRVLRHTKCQLTACWTTPFVTDFTVFGR